MLITSGCFPILAFIDQSLNSGHSQFADTPYAPQLEQYARVLTEQYWSDSVWTTGLISEAALCHICDALERERRLLADREDLVTDTVSTAA
jgi:hypothetical protein